MEGVTSWKKESKPESAEGVNTIKCTVRNQAHALVVKTLADAVE